MNYDGKFFISEMNTDNGAGDGQTVFHYHHINGKGQVQISKRHSIPEILSNGKLKLYEKWQWFNGDKPFGSSILIEK